MAVLPTGLAGGGDRLLQVTDQLRDRPVFVVRNAAERTVVMAMRRESESLEQGFGRNVVGVRDKRHRHPGANVFTFEAHAPRVLARAKGQCARQRDRQQEREAEQKSLALTVHL